MAQALTEEVLQNEADSEPEDEALLLRVALLHPLPLRECELLPEPLRVAELVEQ